MSDKQISCTGLRVLGSAGLQLPSTSLTIETMLARQARFTG